MNYIHCVVELNRTYESLSFLFIILSFFVGILAFSRDCEEKRSVDGKELEIEKSFFINDLDFDQNVISRKTLF